MLFSLLEVMYSVGRYSQNGKEQRSLHRYTRLFGVPKISERGRFLLNPRKRFGHDNLLAQ